MSKTIYYVETTETFIMHYAVKANSPEEAKVLVTKENRCYDFAQLSSGINVTNINEVSPEEYCNIFNRVNENGSHYSIEEKLSLIFEKEPDQILGKFVDALSIAIDKKDSKLDLPTLNKAEIIKAFEEMLVERTGKFAVIKSNNLSKI